jgi:hypothetical protein
VIWPEQAKGQIDEAFRTVESLTLSLDEIVRAVNPAADMVEPFAARLCTFAPRFYRRPVLIGLLPDYSKHQKEMARCTPRVTLIFQS